MTDSPDILTQAFARDPKTGREWIVHANDLSRAQSDSLHFSCLHCKKKGLDVQLKYVSASEDRKSSFRTLNKKTGVPKPVEEGGFERNITFKLPAHFDRWPGGPAHGCDHPARYAPLRGVAMRLNAQVISKSQYLFPISINGKRLHDDEAARQNDLRNSFRPVGLSLEGIYTAVHIEKFFAGLARDPDVLPRQFFHDGHDARPLSQVYFEKPADLYAYLHTHGKVGAEKSTIVMYLSNPNTSKEAFNDAANKGGLLDRSAPQLDDGSKLKLFIRAMNKNVRTHLYGAALSKGFYRQASLMIIGEAYLRGSSSHEIELQVFREDQAMVWPHTQRYHKVIEKYASPPKAQQSMDLSFKL